MAHYLDQGRRDSHKVVLAVNLLRERLKFAHLLAVAIHQWYRKARRGDIPAKWEDPAGRGYFRLFHEGVWYGVFRSPINRLHIEDRRTDKIIYDKPFHEAMCEVQEVLNDMA